MSDEATPARGPVEAGHWPAQLKARVVSPGDAPRVQGFDVLGDLAAQYNFGEFVVIALTGHPPDRAVGAAVNTALVALGAVSIAEAPVHAASLSRLGGAPASVVLSTGMLGLAEQAEHQLAERQTAEHQTTEAAQALTSSPNTDTATFLAALPRSVRAALQGKLSSVQDAALAVLVHAGLTTQMQQTAALCLARLPALAAEAAATPAGDLRSYPMRLPDFEYTEELP